MCITHKFPMPNAVSTVCTHAVSSWICLFPVCHFLCSSFVICHLCLLHLAQMAIQITWYRMYKSFVLTYEAATTRMFYQGRTETIRPISEHSCNFVKAFDNPDVSIEEKKALFTKAVRCVCMYVQCVQKCVNVVDLGWCVCAVEPVHTYVCTYVHTYVGILCVHVYSTYIHTFAICIHICHDHTYHNYCLSV